jgi:hypothetical protein
MWRHRVARGVAVLALGAWCGWVSGFHRTTVAAEITWLITVSAAVAFDLALWRGTRRGRGTFHLQLERDPWPRPGRGGTGPALRGVAPWLALIVALVAWEVLGIDTGPHQYHLTISALAQAYRPLNAALLLAWILAGLGYEVARVRTPAGTAAAGIDGRAPEAPGQPGAFAMAAGSLGIHHGLPALLLPQNPTAGVAFWVAVSIAACLIDVAARRSNGRHATAEEFVRFVSAAPLANLALIAAWGFAGYHLFAR